MFTLPNNFASLDGHYYVDQLHSFFWWSKLKFGLHGLGFSPLWQQKKNSEEKEIEPSRCGD
jgi:hypothetical protein